MTTAISTELENYATPEKWGTETLIDFLKTQGLNLDEEDFSILRREKIDGQVFLKLTKEDFNEYGFKGGPSIKMADEVNALKDNTKRPFSSYRSLKEVLAKYEISGDSITSIKQFQ